MQLTTKIEIKKGNFQIQYSDKVMLLGSCFADEVGAKFAEGGMEVLVNPFGTLYNPASIAAMLLRCISENGLTDSQIFEDKDGVWHSWMHHSRFSASSMEELIRRADEATMKSSEFLRNADVLIITLGTAIIYRLKESGMLVANCHKQLDSLFVRERLSAYDIVDQWQMLLQILQSVNPKLKVIFTVSPIRHKRDGYHINNISKGILLDSVDQMVNGNCLNGTCSYFPSYEIMLDELRDYRFYADDMIHPSPLAVNYIWERFQETYMDNQTKDSIAKARKAFAQGQHRFIIN